MIIMWNNRGVTGATVDIISQYTNVLRAENPVDFPQGSWPCRHQQVRWFSVSPDHWRGAGPGENREGSARAQTSWKIAHTGAGKEAVTLI